MATLRSRSLWRKGFTLTELLVGVGILAILVSVFAFSFVRVWSRSLDRVGEVYAWNVLRTVVSSHLAMGGDLDLTQRAWGEDCGVRRAVRVGEETFVIAPPPKGVASCALVFERAPAKLRVRVGLDSGQTLEVSDGL